MTSLIRIYQNVQDLLALYNEHFQWKAMRRIVSRGCVLMSVSVQAILGVSQLQLFKRYLNLSILQYYY